MKIELKKSKLKDRPHTKAHHPHIRGRWVEFEVDAMQRQEQTPNEESGGNSDDCAEFDEFEDAAEGPSTEGQEQPGERLRKKLPVRTAGSDTEDGEYQKDKKRHGPEMEIQHLSTNGDEAGREVEDGNNQDADEHVDLRPIDESSDFDSGNDDDSQWNAVCVACLRVYSRDPDLTITLVDPEDRQGASNLVRGQDPAGATM